MSRTADGHWCTWSVTRLLCPPSCVGAAAFFRAFASSRRAGLCAREHGWDTYRKRRRRRGTTAFFRQFPDGALACLMAIWTCFLSFSSLPLILGPLLLPAGAQGCTLENFRWLLCRGACGHYDLWRHFLVNGPRALGRPNGEKLLVPIRALGRLYGEKLLVPIRALGRPNGEKLLVPTTTFLLRLSAGLSPLTRSFSLARGTECCPFCFGSARSSRLRHGRFRRRRGRSSGLFPPAPSGAIEKIWRLSIAGHCSRGLSRGSPMTA